MKTIILMLFEIEVFMREGDPNFNHRILYLSFRYDVIRE
jgi:hypothetical protein